MKKFGKILIVVGMLATLAFAAGCSDDKPSAPPPKKPAVKLDLPWTAVKMKQGKELQLAVLNNADKINIDKIYNYPSAIAKIGDNLYIRNANTSSIAQAKLEGTNLNVLNPNFVQDVSEKSFLSTDGKNLYYSNTKYKICIADAAGKTEIMSNDFFTGLVAIPGKTEGMTFSTSRPVRLVDLSEGKIGKEISIVIPDMANRKILATPSGLVYDDNTAYLYGSTLDNKMSVGAIAAYDLKGQQKYVIGAKHDKERKPGYLASAAEVVATRDYLFVLDANIRQINIFNKKDGKIVDLINADKLFSGQRSVHLMTYVDNNVLAIVRSTKKDEADKVFMLHMEAN